MADQRVELGDLFEITGRAGTHRVLCGDATSAEDVGRLLGDRVPLLMVTDPPYGVRYDPAWRAEVRPGQGDRKHTVMHDDRADWLAAWQLFPGDIAYVWHSGLHAATVADSLEACRFGIRAQVIWSKSSPVFSRGHYHWQHEPCFYAVRHGKTARWSGDRRQRTVWPIDNLNRRSNGANTRTDHATQKPVECMARAIHNHGDAGDSVYDPFLGSGTTLFAAEHEGRNCVGLDLDPACIAMTLDRARHQGMRPRRVGRAT